MNKKHLIDEADMLVMLVSHAVIYTNVLKNTKILLRQLASIFATNIFWLLRILQRTLVSRCFLFTYLRPTLNLQSDSIRAKVFN